MSTLSNPLNTSQKWLAGCESLETAERLTNTAYFPPEVWAACWGRCKALILCGVVCGC